MYSYIYIHTHTHNIYILYIIVFHFILIITGLLSIVFVSLFLQPCKYQDNYFSIVSQGNIIKKLIMNKSWKGYVHF